MARTAIAALLVAAFFGGAVLTAQSTETTLDREVRASYARVEAARGRMNGEMSDSERQSRVEAYRKSALEFVEKYGSKEGRMTVGHYDIGRAYIDLQDPANAAKHFKRFLGLAPGHSETEQAELFLGDCYRSTSQLAEAASLYLNFPIKYPKSEKRPYAALGLATTHFLDLRFDEAAKTYDALVKEFPEHEAAADGAFQVVDALIYAGRFDEARRRLATLMTEAKDAPELQRKNDMLNILGKPAPSLVGVEKWIGAEASTLKRNERRVVVLCFFMNNNIPSALMLQFLSDLEQSSRGMPLTVWGLTKAYKAGKHPDWTMDLEAKWLDRYRKNPRFVLQRELRKAPRPDAEDASLWEALEKPIRLPFALAKDFDNHRAYGVRGVPCVVLIDKKGKVRMIEQGGQPVGGFQTRLLTKMVRSLAAE